MLELGQGRRGVGGFSCRGLSTALPHCWATGCWDFGSPGGGAVDAGRGAKVINLGVLIGTGVISSEADWHSV